MGLPIYICFALAFALGCGGDLYDSCDEASDCDAPDGKEAACVDKEGGGFCTWQCATDPDCSAEGNDLVCASFEETAGTYCFPSCADGAACPSDFECRSTGGGTNQRMVCFPS